MLVTVRRWILLTLGAVLALAGEIAAAQTNAGQFLTVVGDVRVLGTDGSQRTPQRGMLLREGETILTGAAALAQVRLLDGGLLSVRADTEMKLDRFAHAGQEDRNSSLLISLVKGGFRSITGLIGQLNRDGYRITTPTATIGIRGTDHEPVVVVPSTAAELQLAPGTYDFVHTGQTSMQNARGEAQTINPNQVGFVSLQGAAPVLLPALPAIYRTATPVPQTGLPPQQRQQTGAPPADRRPGDDAHKSATPGGGLRQTDPAREPIRTTPLESRPGAAEVQRINPGAVAPIQTAPALQQSPSGVVAPSLQQAPTTIQTAPIQQPLGTVPLSPALKGPAAAPVAPVAPTAR